MNSPDYERGYLDGRDDARQTIAKMQRTLTKALEENLRLRNGASASSGISALAESPENSKNSTTP
jgi:hypothetical protein